MEKAVKSGKRLDKRVGPRLPTDSGWKKGGNHSVRVRPLRSFEDWVFSSRELHSFEMVMAALLEDAQKRKNEVERKICELECELELVGGKHNG